jgi:hypothetical protein
VRESRKERDYLRWRGSLFPIFFFN